MLPIKSNNDQSACDPVSSNCVIWQGPDIPCIDLCHGDSISDITAKLAAELCDVLGLLELSKYDVSCFTPVCPVFEDFSDLVQFIIDKLCELETCCNAETPPASGCPECVMTIAACFQYVNELGDTITTMNLDDYVTAIGNKVCTLEATLTALSATVTDHETRIEYIEENCCGDSATPLPTVPESCLNADLENIPIVDFITILEGVVCDMQNNTGSAPQEPPCFSPSEGAPTSLNPANIGANIEGWNFDSFGTTSGSLENAWRMLCDLYFAVKDIQTNCCAFDCVDINAYLQSINYTGSAFDLVAQAPSGWLGILGGSTIYITDAWNNSAEIIFQTNIGTTTTISQPASLYGTQFNVFVALGVTDGTNECTKNTGLNVVSTPLSISISTFTVPTPGTTTAILNYGFNSPDSPSSNDLNWSLLVTESTTGYTNTITGTTGNNLGVSGSHTVTGLTTGTNYTVNGVLTVTLPYASVTAYNSVNFLTA
jgi:hypothetical protein